MTPREAILDFLAQRAPAAFCTATIARRVQRSGLCDAVTIDATAELSTLASDRVGRLVDVTVDPVTMARYWFATPAGVRAWALRGEGK